jgi:ankyrin repeat protein
MHVRLRRAGFIFAVCGLAASAVAAANDLRVVEAARNDDRDAVHSLLKQHANVNGVQADGTTALAWAAYNDDVQLAESLIAVGAKVDAVNDYGIGALWLACANGSSAMVEALLRARVNVAIPQWSGATPLMMCAKTGNVAAVKAILARGPKVNVAERAHGQTALMWATSKQHQAVVGALIAAGANVNASTKGGVTALMLAAQQGDIESARLLLDAGANINAATTTAATWVGDTPLLLAAASGHEELAIFLLDHGARPDAADEWGYTALHYSMMHALADVAGVRIPDDTWATYLFRPDMPSLVRALLAHGANPNARIAKYGGANKLLSSRKDDPSKFQVYEVGATPFLLAAFANDVEIMRLLVKGGADPNLATVGKTTPLMEAAGLTRRRSLAGGGGHSVQLTPEQMSAALEAVKLCVELGADVNAVNDVGLTALHGAAFNGSDDLVRYLVAQGAHLDARDATGQTPLDKAMGARPKAGVNFKPNGHDVFLAYNGWPSTVALLKQLGAKPGDGAPAAKPAAVASIRVHE